MEELGSMWAYEESMEEMKQKLLCTSLELESVKMEVDEERKKYKDNVKHLLGLLKIAYQERDEAREQLNKLLDKLAPPNPSFNEPGPGIGHSFGLGVQPDPYLVPAKANSSVTESNNSHSPVESFLDAVSSPDSSGLVFVNRMPNSSVQEYVAGPVSAPKIDRGSAVINGLANGKILPQKGKLLQAVMEAGPLLQTLMVAGPLPQWRNPPPLQPIRIPPVVSIKGCGSNGFVAQKPVSLGGASPQLCSSSVLGNYGSPYNTGGHLLPSGLNAQVPTMAKRQRFQ